MRFINSECRNKGLHKFELVGEAAYGVLERCERCGGKVSFRVVDGRIDTNNYLSYHMRNALPREHRLFEREYAR